MDAVASFEMVIKPQERLYLNIVSYDSLTASYLNHHCGVLPLLIIKLHVRILDGEILILETARLELGGKIISSGGQQAGGLKPACRQGQTVLWLTMCSRATAASFSSFFATVTDRVISSKQMVC